MSRKKEQDYADVLPDEEREDDTREQTDRGGSLRTVRKDRGLILLLAIIGILAVLLVWSCLQLFHLPPAADKGGRTGGESGTALPAETEDVPALAAPEDMLPDRLRLGELIPDARIQNEQGEVIQIMDLAAESENGIWIFFWASWCPDCTKQFGILKGMESLAKEYGVTLVMTDRLEAGKETREAALEKLREFGSESACWFDPDRECYDSFGMHEIPGSVMVDRQGRVTALCSGIKTAGEYRGLLDCARNGRDAAGKNYMLTRFSAGDGGIRTSDLPGPEAPSGTDVLSESQGLLMMYALETEQRDLFDSAWQYTRTRMIRNGLPAWYVTEEGETAAVNALTDDLRIWYALRRAGEKWNGEYEEEAEQLRGAIRDQCLNGENGYVDYTDLTTGTRAGTIALCYLDPVILQEIAGEDPRLAAAAEKGTRLVTEGFISSGFPLYYGSWSYETGRYSDAAIHTAEALCTLWNLSRAGLLREESLKWLRDRVAEGNLAARYEVSGERIRGYEYHSTAVYGLAALIAMEAGDRDLREEALRRMDRLRVWDTENPKYGAYAPKKGEIRAFDQLIQLLVNGRMMGE